MRILRYDCVDSTNSVISRTLAEYPDTEEFAIIADEQTAGRGRNGRTFSSRKGMGVYFSMLMRPECEASEYKFVTPLTAVAVQRAIQRTCNVNAGIKWPNDVVIGGRKLCGILTELVSDRNGKPCIIVGIGINVAQTPDDFPEEIRETAVSLQQYAKDVDPEKLIQNLSEELEEMKKAFPKEKAHYLDVYRIKCVTTGKEIDVISSENGSARKGFAQRVRDDFTLLVKWEDGSISSIDSGEVSIRNR